MPRKTITLEIDTGNEALLRQFADFLVELKDPSAEPNRSVFAVCEDAAIVHQRTAFPLAVKSRINFAEKKCGR